MMSVLNIAPRQPRYPPGHHTMSERHMLFYEHTEADTRPVCSCHSIVKYTGKDRTIDVLRKMPQDIGDMIGKMILNNQLMSKQGNALIERKIMSWISGHQCFEEWLGNIPKETYFLPHTRLPATITTRSSAPCHFFPFTIYTYQNDTKQSFEVMVPAWWIDIWFKGRAQAVKCANSWGYAEDTETNWYDVLSRGTPTLGQWCWMAVQHNLYPRQWHLQLVKDTAQCYTPRTSDVHSSASGYIPGFPNCNSPSIRGAQAKKDFTEMCKGFAYKGKAPVAWITAKNTGKSYDPEWYYSDGQYLGNRGRGMRGMKFAENRFWFKNEYPTW